MTLASCILGAALVVASPTNAPASFSTEAEQTFTVPDISERDVWLDCGVDFAATASNRLEIALGPDVDGDGSLDDCESPFALALDCGRMEARDGAGNVLFSGNAADGMVRMTLVPAKGAALDAWRIAGTNGVPLAAGVFPEGTAPIKTWNLARVRMGGPVAATARTRLQRNRHATVFIVR